MDDDPEVLVATVDGLGCRLILEGFDETNSMREVAVRPPALLALTSVKPAVGEVIVTSALPAALVVTELVDSVPRVAVRETTWLAAATPLASRLSVRVRTVLTCTSAGLPTKDSWSPDTANDLTALTPAAAMVSVSEPDLIGVTVKLSCPCELVVPGLPATVLPACEVTVTDCDASAFEAESRTVTTYCAAVLSATASGPVTVTVLPTT